MYRAPASSPENNDNLLNQIIRANEISGQNRILLMGDFNLKEINWLEEEVSGAITAIPSKFYECTKDCFLQLPLQLDHYSSRPRRRNTQNRQTRKKLDHRRRRRCC